MAKNIADSYPDGTHAIETGLYIRKKGDRASWFVRVQQDGKRHDIGLGSTKLVGEAEAKKKALLIRADVERGATPWIKAEKRDVPTFGDYFPTAFRRYVISRAWKRERTVSIRESLIKRRVLPDLKDIRLCDITKDDVLKPIEAIWAESPSLGNRARKVVEKVLDLAVVDGYLTENPARWAGCLALYLPSKKSQKVKHYEALSFDECRRLAVVLMLKKSVLARALLMVMLTARRISEVTMTKWSDIDLNAALWTVPDENMKVSRDTVRRVPLPTQLVDAMRTWPHNGEYVFTTYVGTPVRQYTVIVGLKRMTRPDATTHGFRSTFIDWCAENEVPIEVAEKCLDHETGNAVRRAYQRSDLLDQRRALLQRYADAIFDE